MSSDPLSATAEMQRWIRAPAQRLARFAVFLCHGRCGWLGAEDDRDHSGFLTTRPSKSWTWDRACGRSIGGISGRWSGWRWSRPAHCGAGDDPRFADGYSGRLSRRTQCNAGALAQCDRPLHPGRDALNLDPDLGAVLRGDVRPRPLAGALAIAFHSIGFIGKMFSEGVEEANRGSIEGAAKPLARRACSRS